MRIPALALAGSLLLPALPAAAAGDSERPKELRSVDVLSWSAARGGDARSDSRFALQVAFGDEAMAGVGQCGNPSDRAVRRCGRYLAGGGPAVVDSGRPSTALGVRFSWRF